MRNKTRINHPPAPALKRRGSNSKPILFKEGLGWLILSFCAILYTATTANTRTSLNSITGVSSSGGFITKPKGDKPLAVESANLDSCALLKLWEEKRPQNHIEAKVQYDTLRLYVEKCAAIDSTSDEAFSHLDGAVSSFPPDDTLRYDRYRNWLISVLYLNTTRPYYFCNCMSSIEGTYGGLSSE